METDPAALLHVRIPTSSALELLRLHAEQGSSGELIYAGDKREVHVFVQRGLVAWATDSGAPQSFIHALRDRCGASEADLQHALEEARVLRRSLSETLTQWKLASWADLRWAIERQLVSALAVLAQSHRAHSLFLARRPQIEHDDRLLFSFEELLAAMPEDAFRSDSTGTFRTARAPNSVKPMHRASLSACDVLVSVRGAERVEIMRGQEVLDSAGRWVEHREQCMSMLSALDDGASLVAAHSSEHSMVGAALSDTNERVWMHLGHGVSLSAALAPLAGRITPSGATRSLIAEHATNAPRWSLGAEGGFDVAPLFAHSEVLAVLIADESGKILAGHGRESFSVGHAIATVGRRLALLQSAAVLAERSVGSTLATPGYRVATREADCWCLGAATAGAKRCGSVWVFTHPNAGLAIGWACLAALVRTAARH